MLVFLSDRIDSCACARVSQCMDSCPRVSVQCLQGLMLVLAFLSVCMDSCACACACVSQCLYGLVLALVFPSV